MTEIIRSEIKRPYGKVTIRVISFAMQEYINNPWKERMKGYLEIQVKVSRSGFKKIGLYPAKSRITVLKRFIKMVDLLNNSPIEFKVNGPEVIMGSKGVRLDNGDP